MGAKADKGTSGNPGRILGIDLGTTNTAMAVWDGDRPRLILTDDRGRLLPSVVAVDEAGEVVVGEGARQHATEFPERTIYSAKRFIGRKYRTAAQDRKAVPYEVVAGDKGEALFRIDDRQWTPAEISAEILRTIKETAEDQLGEDVTRAVITVPAYFNNPQREATKEAGRLAGLEVLRIINEPTAAALAYGLDKIEDDAAVVVVYDFGGGTFDVSLLSVGDDLVEVIATHGDTHLGGDDIDEQVAEWIADQVDATTGPPPDIENPDTLERIRRAAQAAKVELTVEEETPVRLELPASEGDEPVRIDATLSRKQFDKMISGLVDRTIDSCKQALKDAKKKPDEVAEVVLVGGSSRIPLVRSKVTKFFGREPRDEVNPEEVVALGAAVQAGILDGGVQGVILVDVTSLSLGIENHEGRAVVVIPRNTTIPEEATRIFTTSDEGQTALHFHVVQGESERAADNESLGRFNLEGLPEAPVGSLRIEVTLAIDINGMVQVRARDVDTGVAQKVTVSVITSAVPEAVRKQGEGGAGNAGTKPGGEPPAPPSPKASAKTSAKAPEPAREAYLELGTETLREAETLLQVPGRKMTGVDRASLIKRLAQLRAYLDGPASQEEVEEAQQAMLKVIQKIRAYKPPRPRAD